MLLGAEPLYGAYQTRLLLGGEDTRIMAQQWIEENAPPGTWRIELGSGSAALPILTPTHVYAREHRFTDSYDRSALIAAYIFLANEDNLPEFLVDISPALALSARGDSAGWALISHCIHPLCGEDTNTAGKQLREQAVWHTNLR